MTERTKPPITPANRVARASTKKRRKPLALFVVPVVLVVLGAGMLLFLGGGTDAIPIIGGGGPDDSVPPFDFKTKKAIAVATVAEFEKAALETSAVAVGEEITPTIDEMFTNAFLDPTNWREGDYEEVFAAFAPISVAAAREGVEEITLGTTAGDVFEDVELPKGRLEYRVLFDAEGNPETAVVRYRFNATAERKDGTYLDIVSHGQLFLKELDGWQIVSFKFIRADREGEPPVATGATGASGGTATTGATGTS